MNANEVMKTVQIENQILIFQNRLQKAIEDKDKEKERELKIEIIKLNGKVFDQYARLGRMK